MQAADHAVIEAAVKAKRAQQEKAGAKVPPPASVLSKAIAAGIWVAAAGSVAAVMLGS